MAETRGSSGGFTVQADDAVGDGKLLDLSALRESRLRDGYFPEGVPPEPEPEPELQQPTRASPARSHSGLDRDMFGHVVEDTSGSSWQTSAGRQDAYKAYVEDRRKQWEKAAAKNDDLTSIPLEELKRCRRLTTLLNFSAANEVLLVHKVSTGKHEKLVRRGVPPDGKWQRGCVWQLFSGALHQQLENPGMYEALTETAQQLGDAAAKGEPAVGDCVIVVPSPRNTSFLQPGQAGTVVSTQGSGDSLRLVVCRGDSPDDTDLYEPSDLTLSSSAEAHRQVELDLHRTLPQHKVNQENFMPALKGVLLAYAYRNQSIGYCQSMNFIAGKLLLYVEEAPAFWMLTTLVEDIMPPTYWMRGGMSGVMVDVGVCEQLVATQLPKLGEHLAGLDAYTYGLRGLLTQWLMTLFVNALPPETVDRVWDNLFYTEKDKILFRVVVALFRLLEKTLLGLTVPTDCATLLREESAQLYDGKKLVELCFDRKMKRFDVTW